MLKTILRAGAATIAASAVVACQSSIATTAPAPAVSLFGTGASFPAPIYQRWFSDYNKKHSQVQISYQSIGSGAGVKQFLANTVDFGASDVAMTPEEIAAVKRGVMLVPITAGAVVVGYNLPGVKELRLPRAVLADIFLGKITTWNDARIVAANPGAKLPSAQINVVHRSDGSGTTAVFSQHLSAISADWKSKVGAGKSLQWPIGIGAKGNEGVSAQLMQTQGTIGYVEYGFARQNHLQTAALQNQNGNFIAYSPKSARESLAKIALQDNFVGFDADPAGASAYPIVSYTWLLLYRHYDDKNKAVALRGFLDWALTDGQRVSDDLGYVPLPASLAHKLQTHIKQLEQ